MNKKKRVLKFFGILALLLVISAGFYTYSVYKSVTATVETMHQPLDREKSEKREEQLSFQKKEPFSVLLLGVDERANDGGRSDTMIVLSVNPNNKSVEMLSIPRDTRTMIAGLDKVTKINRAFAYGGAEMAVATVEQFLDIPIDYFIKVNMESFKEIVDALGGITVFNDLDFAYGGTNFPAGEVALDGKDALNFIRMRYEDKRGDFGRQIRQREVIKAIIDKGASFTSLARYESILEVLGDNIKTNLTFSEMKDIQQNYKDARKQIHQNEVKGEGQRIYDEEFGKELYFLVVPQEEQLRLQSLLKKHLEIENS
ncbi:LCP family protein [Bacillus sp. JJ1609]|uniref:LCP family glycopolymer transferase n=1 Tax=Bacillus sp. JJ1609 TaxID=3122977 RepID=UPI002FFD9FC3